MNSLLSESLPLFGLEMANPDDFSVTEIIMHKGGNSAKLVILLFFNLQLQLNIKILHSFKICSF